MLNLAELKSAYDEQIIATKNESLQWHIKTLADFLGWLGEREIDSHQMLNDVMHEYADETKLDDEYENYMRNMSLANCLVWHKKQEQVVM